MECLKGLLYCLKHLSHFVKAGAVLLDVKGSWAPNSMLFKNPDGSKVAVIMNPLGEDKNIKIFGKQFILKPYSFNTILV